MSTLKLNQWLNPDGTENYKVRAWVNFNGSGVVAIRAAGNVSSITDNGAGDYTVNFASLMQDTNYTLAGGLNLDGRTEPYSLSFHAEATRLAASCRLNTRYLNSGATNGVQVDFTTVSALFVR